jgi:hypothetical protein
LTFTAQAHGFAVSEFDVTYENRDGSPQLQAGAHPFSVTAKIDFAAPTPAEKAGEVPLGSPKDLTISLPAGLTVDPSTVPYCSTADFFLIDAEHQFSNCPPASSIGALTIRSSGQAGGGDPAPAFNLAPPPGVVAKIGFVFFHLPIAMQIKVNPEPPHNLQIEAEGLFNFEPIGATDITLWGVPADPGHDPERVACAGEAHCTAGIDTKPYLTLPRSCSGPLVASFEVNTWSEPESVLFGSSESHDETGNPQGLGGCDHLGFAPAISAKPTTLAANSPTGLDFSLDLSDEGITSPEGLAGADLSKAVFTLPEGFTINPSVGAGLNVCARGDLLRETAFSDPGKGCPDASKIGSVDARSPVFGEELKGALYQATPYENSLGSLIALYLVLKNPNLGIAFKVPLEVKLDPRSGQITATAKDLPQIPLERFRLHFREGTRSPLASPPACGTYEAKADLYPSSANPPTTTTSTFRIISGPDGTACPTGGLPPFKPGLVAGSLNNAAGRFSPFYLRMFRGDTEQEIVHFSIKLPPGISAKLAAIPYCPGSAIALATSRSGPHGGLQERLRPSCRAQSLVGHTQVGFGVGPALAYAPGSLYLAGPYNGSALSLVSITSGLVGPFDLGTVVVREALKIDPETAEVFIDSTGSDPIPHIIRGVPVHLRDIRAYVDRPSFVLNPSNCKRTSTATTLLGSGLDFASAQDDRPVTVSTPFQAADCAALSFKPKLSLKLKGGSRRGAHPSFQATLKMGGIGEAGIREAQVTLPRSEFIENAHFQTICTRAQFKAGEGLGGNCPKGSIYGYAKAITPILSEPLQGPVFLRSSEHKLPDLVLSLHNSQAAIVIDGRIDSVKGKLRASFTDLPDAPLESLSLRMAGAEKGLFVNSTDLCKATHRAKVSFAAQNGKSWSAAPVMVPSCKGKAKRPRAHKR